MTKAAVEVVWKGSEALRPFLVPISELEPFPGNPRRGDIVSLRSSLERFGQTKPILTDGAKGHRIVAGHHVSLAATELGWTHVAAIPNEFANEDEARAYLLADNRSHDRGQYDTEVLLAQLKDLQETPVGLEGTGYSEEDVAELDRGLDELRQAFQPTGEEPPRLDERSPEDVPVQTGFEVPLLLETKDQRQQFAGHVKMLEREWGVTGVTAVVVRAVREAAAST